MISTSALGTPLLFMIIPGLLQVVSVRGPSFSNPRDIRLLPRWQHPTRNELDPRRLELLDPLRRLAPPATVIYNSRYCAFAGLSLLSYF
jgi:hypothetical protein